MAENRMLNPLLIILFMNTGPGKKLLRTMRLTTDMDRLDAIFKMQKELADMMKPDRYPADRERRVSALCTAMIHEAAELQRLTNWKWWKSPVPFDESKAREELADILHFVIQAHIEMGMTPEDILKEYASKNHINRERQNSGY